MKTTYAMKLARMAAYLRSNPDVTLPSGRVISACELALVRIYQRQTSDEKLADETRHDNNRGFQAVDAKWGGKMARVIIAGGRLYSHNIPRSIRLAVKYRRQLVELADARAASREAPQVTPQTSGPVLRLVG